MSRIFIFKTISSIHQAFDTTKDYIIYDENSRLTTGKCGVFPFNPNPNGYLMLGIYLIPFFIKDYRAGFYYNSLDVIDYLKGELKDYNYFVI